MTTRTASEPELPKGNVLFIGAHPDDEAGFYAGLIRKLTEHEPERAHVITATLGKASTVGSELVVAGGHRLDEFSSSLDSLGVPEENRLHLDLPDGELHKPANIHEFADRLMGIAEAFDISSFVTPGWSGVDSHSDHKAAHISGIWAAWRMRKERSVQVWGLDITGQGELTVSGFEEQKRKALLSHSSQFPDEAAIDKLVAAHPAYAFLIHKEAYRRNDSWLDVGRATLRLTVPYSRNIPQT